MKALICFLVSCLASTALGQLTQLKSNTTTHLYDLSVIGNNIVINGRNDYIRTSYNECADLKPVATPAPQNYLNRLIRVDTNLYYLLSYTPSQTLIYKSLDGGKTWQQKLDTTGYYSRYFCFFDGSEGLVSEHDALMGTKDGGNTWVNGTSFFSKGLLGISCIESYGDSLVGVGGSNTNGGGFLISKDRGNTWPIAWGVPGNSALDFFFFNKDTLFCLGDAGLAKSTDMGKKWIYLSPPVFASRSIHFRNKDEGYLLGSTSHNLAVILKTTDLGQTWSSFETGIKTLLYNIAFLNDSIAVLTGSDGVLLRWNYKNTIFTNLGENVFENAGIKVFPNPASDKLRFEYENNIHDKINLCISNTLGQVVHSKNNIDLDEEFDISFLNSGVYYLKLESLKGQKVFKVVKE